MKEKIRIHVNNLFEEAPNIKSVFDLKEELISNLNAKYDDLLNEGKKEEEAYETTIIGIGDVNELIESIKQENPMNQKVYEKRRKKNALIVTIAVGLYILSFTWVGISTELDFPQYASVSLFLIIAGFATCLLIYHNMSRPKYEKEDNTIVEEFKEWKSNKEKEKEVARIIHSILWLLVAAFYFIFSFMTMSWAYSWIIFLIGAAGSNIIRLYFKLKE